MEPQFFPFFSALKRNNYYEILSVSVSSRSLGCSTVIESLIPALTSRVLQVASGEARLRGPFLMLGSLTH